MHIFSDTSLQMKETVNPVHLYRLHKQIVWVPCGSMVCQGTAGGNGRERFSTLGEDKTAELLPQ